MIWSFIVFQEIIVWVAVFAAEEHRDSRSAYFITRENKQPIGHVSVKQFQSPSFMSCSQSCLRNSWCTSTNFKEKNEDKGTCELNKNEIAPVNQATHLIDQPGVTFSTFLKNPCDKTPCMNNGTCSPISFRDGTYQCTCHQGYFGDECEIDAPECRDYAVLSEPNRHPSYGRGRNSDSSLVPGWYRFQSSSYTRMIDSCIPHHRCRTDMPGWLKGDQPEFEDGIVERKACFHGYNKCCYRRVQIRMRECQGFYVYELQPSPAGRFRYCANA